MIVAVIIATQAVVWVFIAQLVDHCSTKTQGPWIRVNLQLLELQLPLRRSYLYLNLYFRGSHHPQKNIVIAESN